MTVKVFGFDRSVDRCPTIEKICHSRQCFATFSAPLLSSLITKYAALLILKYILGASKCRSEKV